MTTPEPQPCRPMWEPQWPQNVYWRVVGFALIFTACTPVMFALAVAVSLSRTDSTGALAVSYFGLGVVMAMGSAQFWRLAGLRFLARRPHLGVHVDGAGTVSVVKPRVLIVPAAIALSGSFVCCATLAWAWWMGWPSGSIPEGDGRKEAAWACALAVTGGKQSRRSTQRAEHRSTRRCIASIATKYVALVRNNPLISIGLKLQPSLGRCYAASNGRNPHQGLRSRIRGVRIGPLNAAG